MKTFESLFAELSEKAAAKQAAAQSSQCSCSTPSGDQAEVQQVVDIVRQILSKNQH